MNGRAGRTPGTQEGTPHRRYATFGPRMGIYTSETLRLIMRRL
jgi:hypothetical protein